MTSAYASRGFLSKSNEISNILSSKSIERRRRGHQDIVFSLLVSPVVQSIRLRSLDGYIGMGVHSFFFRLISNQTANTIGPEWKLHVWLVNWFPCIYLFNCHSVNTLRQAFNVIWAKNEINDQSCILTWYSMSWSVRVCFNFWCKFSC